MKSKRRRRNWQLDSMLVQPHTKRDVGKLTFSRFFAILDSLHNFNLVVKGPADMSEEIEIQRISEGVGHDSLYAKDE